MSKFEKNTKNFRKIILPNLSNNSKNSVQNCIIKKKTKKFENNDFIETTKNFQKRPKKKIVRTCQKFSHFTNFRKGRKETSQIFSARLLLKNHPDFFTTPFLDNS